MFQAGASSYRAHATIRPASADVTNGVVSVSTGGRSDVFGDASNAARPAHAEDLLATSAGMSMVIRLRIIVVTPLGVVTWTPRSSHGDLSNPLRRTAGPARGAASARAGVARGGAGVSRFKGR